MAFTPIPIGSLAWGTPVNDALSDQDARISALEAGSGAPSDQGLIAAPYDIALTQSATSPTSGAVHMIAVEITADVTVSNLVIAIFTAGSGLVAGQNFAGLYDSAGTRIGLSADQTVSWGTAGIKTMAITPVAVTAGRYYVAVLSNGTTPPSLLRALSAAGLPTAANLGRTAADGRWTIGPVGVTALPASVVPASRTLYGITLWAGVS